MLALVIDTQGSTYSKRGDFMLITAGGDYQGLLSGGCVEGDLALRAQQCSETGSVARVLYDLGGEHDALWGMGAGCDGTLTILLIPLTDVSAMQQLVAGYADRRAGAVGFAWDANGVHWAFSDGQQRGGQVTALEARLDAQFRDAQTHIDDSGESGWGVLFVKPAPTVLICGAGRDVNPLCELLHSLGWHVSVFDHRDAYIDALAALPGVATTLGEATTLAQRLPLSAFDAALVMSHHLERDGDYLVQLSTRPDWPYIAVLGPPHRKQRLLDAMPHAARTALVSVLKGPAGLAIGGREPVSIALSIVAQMHESLAACGALDTPATAIIQSG